MNTDARKLRLLMSYLLLRDRITIVE